MAEAYIKGDFETDNLTNLIELSAKNIKVIHKFSGFLDFPFVNSLKNIFIDKVKKTLKFLLIMMIIFYPH